MKDLLQCRGTPKRSSGGSYPDWHRAGGGHSVWILNSTGDEATVTLSPLGVSSDSPEKVLIPPGTYLEVPVDPLSETGNSGMLVEANVPISVAVTIAGPQGVAFIGGVGIG